MISATKPLTINSFGKGHSDPKAEHLMSSAINVSLHHLLNLDCTKHFHFVSC